MGEKDGKGHKAVAKVGGVNEKDQDKDIKIVVRENQAAALQAPVIGVDNL